jgi:hypothetical protein
MKLHRKAIISASSDEVGHWGAGGPGTVYGRLVPDRLYSCDQMPLPFDVSGSRTLNPRGEAVQLSGPKQSGLRKRQATIQVTFRAEGDQNIPPALIFRGLGNMKPQEQLIFEGLARGGFVDIYWQPKAWADEVVMLMWLETFLERTSAQRATGEVTLGMDSHGAQKTTKFRERASAQQVELIYSPADCTDAVAPPDHHLQNALKLEIRKQYEKCMEGDDPAWSLDVDVRDGTMAMRRRVYMAIWVARAWAILRLRQDYIRTAFVETGWLLRMDDTDKHLVKIAGLEDLIF